jgi:hypothetical protein
MKQQYVLIDMRTREHLVKFVAASDTAAATIAQESSTKDRRVVAMKYKLPDSPLKTSKRRKKRATK